MVCSYQTPAATTTAAARDDQSKPLRCPRLSPLMCGIQSFVRSGCLRARLADVRVAPFHCSVCDLSLHSEEAFNLHLDGNHHMSIAAVFVRGLYAGVAACSRTPPFPRYARPCALGAFRYAGLCSLPARHAYVWPLTPQRRRWWPSGAIRVSDEVLTLPHVYCAVELRLLWHGRPQIAEI